MKRHLACLAFLSATPSLAQTSPFDGTWQGDLASAKLPAKPDVFSVADGVFRCSTCTPPVTTPADGRFHAVPSHDYFDEMSVTVDGPTQVS
ncbi:hypothetical protein [Sphingomonas bacterium]|uniref:hypothetical protein n=1 Tax=Sphingomonas bacterium TaxID=1895847 RepID=UPI0015757C67|nr:hypothetical protein [Sphingomonas bacterium]